jgi:hypothetical protein
MISAIGIVQYFDRLQFNRISKIIYILISVIITVAFIAISLIEHYKEWLLSKGLIKDTFAAANLRAEVRWNGAEILIAVVFAIGAWLVYRGIERSRKKLLISGLVLNLAFIYLAIAAIIPKVELYSQHAAIEFYKACAGRECYVETHGFKSYAYLFYSQRKQSDYVNPDQVRFIEQQLDEMEKEGHSRLSSYPTSNLLWMEHGRIDRPAYIVVKTPSESELLRLQDMHKLYEKNGYSFFVRLPAK